MRVEAGATVGHIYKLQQSLGAGDQRSWLAISADGSRHVVKLWAQPPAELPPSVIHPALIRLERADDGVWARPYIEGESAADDPRISRDEALVAGRRLAEALAVLHTAGVAHGNLQPSNVIVRPGASPVLVDARGQGSAEADIAALSVMLREWLPHGQISPRLAQLLAKAAEGGVDAASLRDMLDDEQLAIARGGADAAAHREVHVSATEPVSTLPAAPRQRPLRLLMAGVLLLALTALVAVIVLLPGEVERPPAARVPPPEPEPVVEPEPRELTGEELETMLEQRQLAQATLDELINLRLELEEKQVERWAAEPFRQALELARNGDEPFRLQHFTQAAEIYGQALAQLHAVAETGRVLLDDALARGQQALEQGESEAASQAFDLALAIEPEQAQALAGAARAETLDEALALQARAQAARVEGRLGDARDALRELKALDPAMPGTDDQLAEIDAAIEDRRFREAMSAGLAAMEVQDWDTARAAFARARQMRPGDPAPGGHLLEVDRRAAEYVLASHRKKAAAAEAQERWASAVRHYQAVLHEEPGTRFAEDGLARARARLALDQELERYLGDAAAWWSDQGRQSARQLLARARAIATPGERLAGQIRALGEELELASRPVPVELVSDNNCNVVVYRVARLGSFDRQQLDLMPGRYTAVASRDGYRDVRREFLVPAGGEPEPVVLKCEERV